MPPLFVIIAFARLEAGVCLDFVGLIAQPSNIPRDISLTAIQYPGRSDCILTGVAPLDNNLMVSKVGLIFFSTYFFSLVFTDIFLSCHQHRFHQRPSPNFDYFPCHQSYPHATTMLLTTIPNHYKTSLSLVKNTV